MRIVFFGTSPFAARILECLAQLPCSVVAVVTRPDRPQGRGKVVQGSAVKEFVREKLPHTPLLQPEKASTPEFCEQLRSFQADLFFVVAYGEILKQELLSLPRQACINVHTSLLPLYRGAAPIQRCLMQGESKSGVTFMEMALKMDAGDILKQEEVTIPPSWTAKDLEEALVKVTVDALPGFLKNFSSYYASKKAQEESRVTWAPKILPEDCILRLERTAQELCNQIRALSPSPGAFLVLSWGQEVRRLKILSATFSMQENGEVGSLAVSKEKFTFFCGKGALYPEIVQLEGKRSMRVDEFLRGVPSNLSVVA